MRTTDILLGIITILILFLGLAVWAVYRLSVRAQENIVLNGSRGSTPSFRSPLKQSSKEITEDRKYLNEAEKRANFVDPDDVPKEEIYDAIDKLAQAEESDG